VTRAKVKYVATYGGGTTICEESRSLRRLKQLVEKCERLGGVEHRFFEVREIKFKGRK
jgi:hypothetical protein